MKPALTAEEWESPVDAIDGVIDWKMGIVDISTDKKPEYLRHALAALALYGQPFGFTREDVANLRDAAAQMPTFGGGPDGKDIPDPELLNLADRIEALLPPEG